MPGCGSKITMNVRFVVSMSVVKTDENKDISAIISCFQLSQANHKDGMWLGSVTSKTLCG